jgi:uncharacterized membrane protein YphA (DoxX/SURF4 family)
MPHWSKHNRQQRGKRFITLALSFFVILFITSFSFPHAILPDVGRFTSGFYEMIARWFGDHVLGIEKPYTSELISDSTGFYINAVVIFIVAILVSITLVTLDKGRTKTDAIKQYLIIICRYYLAIQLLAYAFAKIFKTQFYLPEPNILFTNVGSTPRDLLYWTVIGTSRGYNIFMGSLELIAACLLLFRRTTLAGALLSFGILINILAINLFYDISVKLYSCFLLLLSVIILAPDLKNLWQVFFQTTIPAEWIRRRSGRVYRGSLYPYIKATVVVLIFVDALLPYFKNKNFNDDLQERPAYHGAYDVRNFTVNNVMIDPTLKAPDRWRRIFIHRQGYFIIQFMNDDMKDLMLQVDNSRGELRLTDYDSSKVQLQFVAKDNQLLQLSGTVQGRSIKADLEKIDLDTLPLLQNEFHWTIDEIKE